MPVSTAVPTRLPITLPNGVIINPPTSVIPAGSVDINNVHGITQQQLMTELLRQQQNNRANNPAVVELSYPR